MNRMFMRVFLVRAKGREPLTLCALRKMHLFALVCF